MPIETCPCMRSIWTWPESVAAGAYLAAAEAAGNEYRAEQALSLARRGLELPGEEATRASLANLSGEVQQGLGRTEEADIRLSQGGRCVPRR